MMPNAIGDERTSYIIESQLKKKPSNLWTTTSLYSTPTFFGGKAMEMVVA